MTAKHQSNCYRTFDGVKWFVWCDILDHLKSIEISELKAAGIRIKLRKHADGFSQAFMHPDDMVLLLSKGWEQ